MKSLNDANTTQFYIDDSLKNTIFRNCLAHYGLGQIMDDSDIVEGDIFKGLTNKVFDLDYCSTKELIYNYLKDLCTQIKGEILKLQRTE